MDEEKRKEIQLLIENNENENESSVIKKVSRFQLLSNFSIK